MPTIRKDLKRFTARATWVALLAILALGFFTTAATAQQVTITSATQWFGKWPAGGALAGGVPSGGSWAMNSMGTIVASTTYGGEVIEFSGSPLTESVAGPYGNTGGVTIDASGNLYVGGQYSNSIIKVPMSSNGTYTFTEDPGSSTVPPCTGTDTSECLIQPLTVSSLGYFGVESMEFDASGDLFFATDGQGSNPYSIYECSTSCLYGASPTAPVLIFQEPTAPDPSTTGQLEVGGMAFDSQGDLFFTDSAIVTDEESLTSNVNEMINYGTGPGAQASFVSAVQIATETNPTPLSDYNEQFVSVAVDSSNNVYFSGTNSAVYEGLSSGSNSTGTVTGIHAIAMQGAKLVLPDNLGDVYVDGYNGGDSLGFVSVGTLTDPTVTGLAQTTTVPATVIDDSGTCTTGTPALTFSFAGTNKGSFSAALTAPTAPATSTCESQLYGVAFPVTLTFKPTALGANTATMTATDGTNSGTATVNGTAEKPQAISFSPPSTITYAPSLTIALTATGGASGNPVTFSVVSGPATMDSTVANQLDVSAPGAVVVNASQAGNSTYAPASVNKTITVTPIAQSISFTPPPARNVTLATGSIPLVATGGASGQPVVLTVDGSSTATATITGSSFDSTTNEVTATLSFTTAGTIVIDANQAASTNGDYAAAPQVQATVVVGSSLLPAGPPVVMSQTTFLGTMAKGGITSSGNPNGATMGVNPINGDGIVAGTYGSNVVDFNITNTNPSYQTILDSGDPGSPAAVAVDSHGNVFVGMTYNEPTSNQGTCGSGGLPCVMKIPFVNGAYTPITVPPTPGASTACTGPTTDTSACYMTNVTAGSVYPIASMAFDAQGNLFYGIQNNSGGAATSGITDPDSIWECDVSCLYGGGDSPVMLFQEPAAGTTSLSPTTSVQLTLGSIAADANDNVFFTDAAIDASGNIHYSDLNEIVNTSGTYPSTATVLTTNIPSAPGEYVGTIDSIAISPAAGSPATSTVYFSDQGETYAFFDDGSALNPTNVQATMWTVSPQGAKTLGLGANGVLYQGNYSGAESADSVWYTTLGSVTVPGTVLDGQTASIPGAAVIGTSTTPASQMYTVLNTDNCTNPPTVTFNAADSQFTAALITSGTPPAATCTTSFTDAAWFPTTLTFAPVSPSNGAVSETLTASDGTNSGTATVSGTAQNLLQQTITNFAGITSPVTYGSGPYTLSATGGASTEPVVFSVDASSTAGVASISGNTLTITGTGNLIIDVNQAGDGTTYQAAAQLQVPITVNPEAQTIAFTTPASASNNVVYGAAAVTLAANGGGGDQPVVFSIDASSTAGAGSLSGSVLTFTGIGTVVIDANQAASSNGDYSAATQVQVSFTVAQATQTITLTPSLTTASYPTAVTLTATGGASGNAVTLSLTSGSSVATLSGNVLTPTGTAFGPVVVTASQAGNADYGAAADVTTTVTFAAIGQVATPAFSQPAGTLYTNGSPSNVISISDSTQGATILYTTDGSDPLTSATAQTYSVPITIAQSETLTAAATELGYTPSADMAAAYTVSNLPPNFTATASPAAVDLSPGTSAIVDITITPNASFTSTVNFACSGAPSGVTCAFSPATLTPTSTNNISTVLTITDASTSSAAHRGPNPFIPGGATFALALCFFGFRKRRGLVLGLVLLAGIFGMTQLIGCGSSGLSNAGTTTSTMTVTATSGSISQTIPVTITIRK